MRQMRFGAMQLRNVPFHGVGNLCNVRARTHRPLKWGARRGVGVKLINPALFVYSSGNGIMGGLKMDTMLVP